MVNIGYAIFKKSSSFVIDSNGMFEGLKLEDELNSITNTIVPLKEINQQLLCFKRIESNKGSTNTKDAFLVILIERIKNNNEDFILGSAICFKEFRVNEDKIIKGVQYLLSQLKRNFESDYDIDDSDLGVILPSTNKDFKIFKNKKLIDLATKADSIGYDKISFSNTDAEQYLNYFCNDFSLSGLECLLLMDSNTLFNQVSNKNNHYKKVNNPRLINPIEVVKENITNTSQTQDIGEIQSKLDTVTTDRNKAQKDKKLYRNLAIGLFCLVTFLGVLYLKNRTTLKTSTKSIYPVEDTLYISHSGYNVNVRSSPKADIGDGNVKTTLSDGDKIFVLGFDKETLWAKIKYNEGDEIGYVSNRLISKQIASSRVLPVNKKAYITKAYVGAPVYFSPKEMEKQDPEIMAYLNNNDKIFVKNKDLRLDTYSVRFEKNNKIYHGYLQRQYFNYQ